ncbi:hypothetical protein CRG98_025834 [Punica granatum]|uniref:Uncharacterized protein n=1 Tax=Punica granatum TaxID=22663 RepID=A0A2I0JCM9_PUNGR|nr:hypothetical protein CRG98_025834 [Punica granatum]
MARLSTPTRSPIGSPTELNRPRRILLQAQRATKHAIQTVQDNQHQPKDGRDGGCAWNPKGHLLPNGLISASRDGSCYRYVGNRQGMLHATQPPTSKEGQAMGDRYQLPHVMQSRPNAKQTTSPDALRDP